jgi:hypothetical protein
LPLFLLPLLPLLLLLPLLVPAAPGNKRAAAETGMAKVPPRGAP